MLLGRLTAQALCNSKTRSGVGSLELLISCIYLHLLTSVVNRFIELNPHMQPMFLTPAKCTVLGEGELWCVENGPEWGESNTADRDDSSMEIIQDEMILMKLMQRSHGGYGGGIDERAQEDMEFKIILRFGEEITSMSLVRLTAIL